MASLDSLTDGQRAVLQLLLRQNKSYDDLADLLKTDVDAVRARARGAVTALGPEPAGIDADRRNEIADYLLGQQSASRRAATREYLEGSAAGRGWARRVANALSPLAGGDLPEVPAEREEVSEAFDALDRRAARQVEVRKSSQLGSRLIAAGIGVVLAIAIILALSLGGDDDPEATATTPQTTTQATTPTGDVFEVKAQGTLRPPEGSQSDARGEVAIVHFPDNDQFRLAFQATGLPPSSTRGSAYGVWLYSSPTQNRFLGFPDTVVGADGKLETVSDLSPDTPTYSQVLLTRETAEAPKQPGTIILRGRLVTAAAPSAGGTATTTTPNTGGTAPTTTTP
ncbi:MAG TPA: hypothetical protein VGV90_09110 [Solirubrobacteraceae bacterium]|nr:hypothetical protein [Solirubrobacteraceae bacterium]